MKVVFLDIDGVLVNLKSFTDRPRGIREKACPDCVSALNEITASTGSKIVVSSSWRKGVGLDWLTKVLCEWGVLGDVIGVTPESNGLPRGMEIQSWLTDNHGVDSFVILDDDDDMEHLSHRLVKTEFEVGLTANHAAKAISILGSAA